MPSKAASLDVLTSGSTSLLVKKSVARMYPCVRSGTFIICLSTYPTVDVSVRLQVSKMKLALSLELEPEHRRACIGATESSKFKLEGFFL